MCSEEANLNCYKLYIFSQRRNINVYFSGYLGYNFALDINYSVMFSSFL
jgi:hypothetical protein